MVLIALGRGAFASGHLDSCRICVCGMCVRGHGAATPASGVRGARAPPCVVRAISKSCAYDISIFRDEKS